MKDNKSIAIGGQYDYKPFGETRTATNDLSRTSFIGKEKDRESNLGDFGVRKYDNDIGRFTSIDPLWEKYYGWTPYHYCRNNPLVRIDGNGLDDDRSFEDKSYRLAFKPSEQPQAMHNLAAAKVEGVKIWGPFFLALGAAASSGGLSTLGGKFAVGASLNNFISACGNAAKAAYTMNGQAEFAKGIPVTVTGVGTAILDQGMSGTMNGPISQAMNVPNQVIGGTLNFFTGNKTAGILAVTGLLLNKIPSLPRQADALMEANSQTQVNPNNAPQTGGGQAATDVNTQNIKRDEVKSSPLHN